VSPARSAFSAALKRLSAKSDDAAGMENKVTANAKTAIVRRNFTTNLDAVSLENVQATDKYTLQRF
jgi:hypothetical protein